MSYVVELEVYYVKTCQKHIYRSYKYINLITMLQGFIFIFIIY